MQAEFRTAVKLLRFVFLVVCIPLAHAQDMPVIRGTINVILANANGIVALTDSRQSAGMQVLSEPAQKLFPIDELSVCTIAGFGSAPLPTFPEFTSNAAGILEDFRRKFSKLPRQTFRTKLMALSFLFEKDLSAIANVRDFSAEVGDYAFELVLAGYEPDGTPKVGWLVLKLEVRDSPNGIRSFHAVSEDIREAPVGKEMFWKIAGQPETARQILEAPQRFSERDPAIRALAIARASKRTDTLTLEQLKNLAIALARQTSLRSPTVGGENQIATLRNGQIAAIEQRRFPEQPRRNHFWINIGEESSDSEEAFHGQGFLVIKSTIRSSGQKLDGNFFFGNHFVDSRIIYDGGITRFDLNNQVTDCVLVVGVHARQNEQVLRHLLDDFRWKEVCTMKSINDCSVPWPPVRTDGGHH